MPFWKKSDDPWDADPARERERRERAEREPAESPLDTLRDWNEARKAKAAERQAELEAQPREICPWCGREMERGYMVSGKGDLIWRPGWMTARSAWLGPPKEVRQRSLRVDDEGDFTTYKTVWYCGDCEKMVIDAKGMRRVSEPYAWPETPEAKELEGYFRDAKGEDGEEEDPS